jgi:hypothetical protein
LRGPFRLRISFAGALLGQPGGVVASIGLAVKAASLGEPADADAHDPWTRVPVVAVNGDAH